jgi:hypothetical protein
MLFFESFDFLNFQNSREEGAQSGQGIEGENVWTNVPPTGWSKDDTGVPGYNNPDLPWDPNANPPVAAGQEDNNGITEWIGWTFPKFDWWKVTAGDQRRSEFVNASGGIMVADNDEWDDAPHPGKGSWLENELYNAKITSPSISLGNVTGPVTLDFDSSWRPEGFDDNAEGATPVNNQTGIINVVFSDGTRREIMHWDSDPTGPFFHDHLPNEHVTLPIGDVPAGASSFKLEFLETKSANDWWWAVDNVAVQGTKTFDGARLIGMTGNQGGDAAENDESLWNIGYVGGPTTNPAYLDGWSGINNPPAPATTAYAQAQFGVTAGSGALRIDAPQDANAVFWGVRSPNVVDALKAGANKLSYDQTFNAQELNGGSFGPAGDPDNSFNGFAQSNELAVVIAVPSGGFIQRNFTAGGGAGSDNPQWNGTDGVRHVSWDLTKFTSSTGQSLADFITANNATEARFWIPTQGSDSNGHQGPMRFYFDNFILSVPGGDQNIGDFDGFSVSKIVKLPFIPDTDAIGFNTESGLLHHTSGASSYSNNPASNGYRDNQFMETVDVVSGTNATHVIFNANSEQFGPPGPRPTWVEPTERRTDEQTDPAFRVQGPNEYHAARDLAWSEQAHAFFVADEGGIYKLTADGQSTFVGDPAFGGGGPKGIAWITLNNKRQLIVGERDGPNLHLIDPLTGQTYGDPVQVTDVDLQPIPGILSLAESPDGNELIAIGKDPTAPNAAFQRLLLLVNPVTGAATKLGQFDIQMADLAFVYPVPAAAARVSEVYVRGSAWSSAFKTYMAGQGLGDANLGYRIDNKAATDIVPWINVDEVVLRYNAAPTGSGIPTPGSVVFDGIRSDYTVSTVTALDPQTFVLRLDRALGNLPTPPGGENGDRITISMAGGPGGPAFSQRLNVLQGDVDRSGSVVANDFSDVKKKFFKSTTAPGSGDTGYTVFHDVDGSGQIVANDFSEVKKRFFDNLPPPPAAASVTTASITSDLFGTKKILA